MASLFRDAIPITYIDPDNNEIATTWDDSSPLLPRVGENIRIAHKPYLVERDGYDLPKDRIEHVWVVVRPA